jgi:hypothetical protein
MLVPIFVLWAGACVGAGAALLRRAPAVSLALFGSVLGAVAGFLVANVDGPAGVPAHVAAGASIGLVANGVLGLLATSARGPSEPLRRAGMLVLIAAPFATAALAALLMAACPLYISGKRTGYCNYQQVDVLGGWASGVIVSFLLDVWFVGGLLLVSARQARRTEGAADPAWRGPGIGRGSWSPAR